MNAVDTNILIYSIDSNDAGKRQRAVELIESLSELDTVMPWQVACKVASVLGAMARNGRFRGNHAHAVTALRSCFPIVLPQHSTLERSLRIQAEAQLSTWDALLIAACAEAGVARLYTEDLQSRPVIDGVTIVNPCA